jgi:type II secretory pathway component PulM
VNRLWAPIAAYLRSRSPREIALLAAAAGVVTAVLVQVAIVSPLRARIVRANSRVERLETELLRATGMAGDVRRLQGELGAAEARIEPGQKTNLLTLLESLAEEAGAKGQLESIKPRPASDNPAYPETRVEVSLKGATLEQAVRFLYRIETAPMHLIVRSIRIKSRADDSGLLDVSFSVSSFVRAEGAA